MINYRQSIWLSNIHTILGSVLLISWALACALLMWNAASGENPLADALTSVAGVQSQVDSW
jgi:hypothetical protein